MSTVPPDVLVTGSSGFIGSHLIPALDMAGINAAGLDMSCPNSRVSEFFRADIRDPRELAAAASHSTICGAVVHLAALGEVMIPFSRNFELHETNVLGTWNVLSAFDPSLFVFASSSSVYGDKWHPASPAWEEIGPVGSYGMSKATGELLCRDWAIERPDRAAVCLRLANVIGPGCRGVLRYIAEHALRYPAGEIPARLRGAGKLIRDYVPVETVVAAIAQCCRSPWTSGVRAINVCSGMGITNGELVEIARPEIERAGLRLRVEWSAGPGAGEARSVILDPQSMEESLSIVRPRPEAITRSAQDSVRAVITAAARERVKCES